jgi:hypothetical protein
MTQDDVSRPKRIEGGFKNTILGRALRKAGTALDFSQDELLEWEKLPRNVRRRMGAEEIAQWRRTLKDRDKS